MIKWTLVLILGFFANMALAYPIVPNHDVTQGDLCRETDRDFHNYRYSEKIPYCERNVSWFTKNRIYNEYNIPKACRHRYTIDHFIPLAIGGNNADTNLWPEHVAVKATRPELERQLYFAIKRGEISQEQAIEVIVTEKTTLKQELRNRVMSADDCDLPTI